MICLAVALPLAAQNAGDFSVTLRADSSSGQTLDRAAIRGRVYYVALVKRPINGPEAVVELDLPGENLDAGTRCTGTRPLRCTVPSESWEFHSIMVGSTMNQAGVQTATARVIAPNDPNSQNDQSSVSLEVVDAPSLVGRTYHASASSRLAPGEATKFYAEVANYNGKEATDVVLTLTLPDGGTFTGLTVTDPAATCVVDPATIVCSLPLIKERAQFEVVAEVKAPERLTGGNVTFMASSRSAHPDFNPADNVNTTVVPLIRHILVTNTNDEGGGSLRQALLDAQQLCATAPCTIDFRIPGTPAGGRFVIQPRTELPEVLGTVKIDGATQKAFGGDANPTGPEIELDGSLTEGPAHGLLLGVGCDMYVLELAIRNFPAPGIELKPDRFDFGNCSAFDAYPATIITGNHITGNYRGIAIVDAPTTSVKDNFIAGNRRAGIFVENTFQVWIERNLVSGNGASGMFLDATYGHAIENRVIANGEWGIARTKRGDLSITRNSIYANRHLAIDYGLDLETPNREDDHFDAPPNKPVLFSAQYDPVANKTVVRGRLDSVSLGGSVGGDEFVIEVYASRPESGEGQAEQWLGQQGVATHADFEIAVDGDHRGKRITATHTRRRRIFFDDFVRNTSELSGGVVAQ
ncbi:MAG TPA: NosD domain-containing protein [Thermoanaerobaculia bacterium]|nr:NosD domain-containing protein [Thermoanaerobaculia bacterium]